MTTTPPVPTVTPSIDAAPCPRVEILISPMPVDADTITITRAYGSQTDTVRGATGVVVAGDFVVVDYEAPFGVDVTYTCVTEDAGGIASSVSDPSTTVNLDVAEVWAQDPLDPSTSMPWALNRDGASDARAKRPSFSGFKLSAPQNLAASIGSRLPIGQSGVRQAPSAMPLVIATTTPDSTLTMLNLLTQAGALLCIRVPAAKLPLVDPLGYYQLGDITPDDTTVYGQVWWTTAATAIVGPSLDVIVPTRTLDDLGGEASTLADFGTLYATLIDLERGV